LNGGWTRPADSTAGVKSAGWERWSSPPAAEWRPLVPSEGVDGLLQKAVNLAEKLVTIMERIAASERPRWPGATR
jgi:hypothetical protein